MKIPLNSRTRRPRTFVIAEAGVNHNGSMTLARRLIRIARDAGADAVKFQTFRADRLVTQSAPKAKYQARATGGSESQFEMLRRLELSEMQHYDLKAYCGQCGIEFLSTPFDADSLAMLTRRIGMAKIKIPSGEVTNAPLLLAAARTRKPLIVSTGMCTLDDVRDALGVLAFGFERGTAPSTKAFRAALRSKSGQLALRKRVTLLHCTTEYPAPLEDTNLLAMDTLRDSFGLPVGLSDHTAGISAVMAAVARGASVIEKHFTLDRRLPGPDHKASLEPGELKAMIQAIREVELCLGNAVKAPAESERKNMIVARKSLVALQPIRRGEAFTERNLGIKRPGGGISPMHFWDWLGRKAERNYLPDELISP